jgi:hypothetical protein
MAPDTVVGNGVVAQLDQAQGKAPLGIGGGHVPQIHVRLGTLVLDGVEAILVGLPNFDAGASNGLAGRITGSAAASGFWQSLVEIGGGGDPGIGASL